MTEQMQLSEQTNQILLQRLRIEDFDELLTRKYLDRPFEPINVNREQAKLYNRRTRGSVRLRFGRYYTAAEYEKWVKQVKSLSLP